MKAIKIIFNYIGPILLLACGLHFSWLGTHLNDWILGLVGVLCIFFVIRWIVEDEIGDSEERLFKRWISYVQEKNQEKEDSKGKD